MTPVPLPVARARLRIWMVPANSDALIGDFVTVIRCLHDVVHGLEKKTAVCGQEIAVGVINAIAET